MQAEPPQPPRHHQPRVAIGYLAFDRHRLVRLTLDRILAHKPANWVLRVWQDGARAPHSGRLVGDPGRIARNLEYFSSLGLAVEDAGGINKGTALSYWQVEHWAFETLDADVCILIEDDIVISRHFFTVMDRLAHLALANPRIGAFSAFGNAGISWPSQWRQRHRLQPMHHRWGYGLTRDYWRRTQGDAALYMALLEGHDYRDRPNERISAWLATLNPASSHITGQDGARNSIMLKLGCFSIMTTPSYAVNIGKRGMHSYPEFFQANRQSIRGRHAFFPWPVKPPYLTQTAADELAEKSRNFAYW